MREDGETHSHGGEDERRGAGTLLGGAKERVAGGNKDADAEDTADVEEEQSVDDSPESEY